ncbi:MULTISPECIES: APC family permease [Heyndrickxia]|uniref:APC family permease n=2 Tax=Bacillaceae TaxID=186817 RepID=UPI002E239274|nr:amino acid permease [Weizmannia sp. CD-2023]MED4322210.1 amino acid permease [Weizmannia sp. CD-2023]MED4892411.1 amino acid permease [Weizmannia sp. CD-2023]
MAFVMGFKKELGLFTAISLGIGGILGAGIFVLSGVAISQAGPAALLSFLIGATLSLMIGFAYVELSKAYPGQGGAYDYARLSRGPNYGFFTGWIYLGAWVIASGYVTLGFGEYMSELTGFPAVPIGILLIVVLAIMNLLGVRISSAFQLGLIVSELILLFIVIAISFAKVDFSNLTPFVPNGPFAVISASLLGFLSLTGWDVIAVASKEIKNAGRNVPLAIFISIITVSIIYIGLIFVMTGILPYQAYENEAAPVVVAVSKVLGNRLSTIIIALIVSIALAATANAFIMVTSRTLYSLSEEGHVPKIFSKINARGVPWVSVIAVNLLKIGVLIFGNLYLYAQGTGFLYLSSFILTLLCLPPFNKNYKRKISLIRKLIIVFSVLLSAFVLVNNSTEGIIYGFVWMIIGCIAFFLTKKMSTDRKTTDL